MVVKRNMTKPIVIIIEGAVGAGKTTLFEKLREELEGTNTCFLREPQFNEVTLLHKTYNPLIEVYQHPEDSANFVCTQTHITNVLSKHIIEEWKNAPLTLMDRWILSCEYFIKLREKRGLITNYVRDFLLNQVRQEQEKFHILLTGTRVLTCLLKTSPKQCAKNILKRGRGEEISNSLEFWEKFNEEFYHMIESCGPKFDIVGDYDIVYNSIKEVCREQLSPKNLKPAT